MNRKQNHAGLDYHGHDRVVLFSASGSQTLLLRDRLDLPEDLEDPEHD